MTQELKVRNSTSATADPLQIVSQEMRKIVLANWARLNSQVDFLVLSKDTHRTHTARWKGMDPVLSMQTQLNRLPKAWWMGTMAVLLIQTLEQITTLDHEVRRQREELSLLESDLFLLRQLDLQDSRLLGAKSTYPEPIAVEQLVGRLDDQLLAELREATISHLQVLLHDSDPTVTEQREALRDSVVEFIEQQIQLVITEAGYHRLPSPTDQNPGSLIESAEQQVTRIGSILSEPRSKHGLRRGEYARVTLNLDCAISMALLSFKHFSKMWAKHVFASTIDGRFNFLEQCISALEPTEKVGAAPLDVVEYRMKAAHDRIAGEVKKYRQMLRRDREVLGMGVGRAVQAVAEAASLKLAFKKIRCLN